MSVELTTQTSSRATHLSNYDRSISDVDPKNYTVVIEGLESERSVFPGNLKRCATFSEGHISSIVLDCEVIVRRLEADPRS